ncbi:hypothetical protein GCWU000324_01779 [Kingella oralis ATCC 51147]|uniref:Uncharacterized protein n=1 Tax=Kingella oralis ATCC 51147 TaxID=629741 RepID=C4GLC2_9NEIS|nr:hypothetical protein GCWU000324_01779 [Kingella oralis ATCC 51147]
MSRSVIYARWADTRTFKKNVGHQYPTHRKPQQAAGRVAPLRTRFKAA